MKQKERFVIDCVPGKNEEGNDVLVLIAKRTYKMDLFRGACTLEGYDEQPPLHGDDVYEPGTDPLTGNLLEDGELVAYKKKVDVVIQGKAYAPGGEPQRSFDVAVEVGPLQKRLRVIGNRRAVWQPPKKQTKKETIYSPPLVTEPEPLVELPLTYSYAYGGKSPLVPPPPPEEPDAPDAAEAPAADAEAAAAAPAAASAPAGAAPKKNIDEYFTPTRPGSAGPADAPTPADAPAAPAGEPFHTGGTEILQLDKLQAAEEAARLAAEEAARKLAEEQARPPEAVDRGGTTQQIDLKTLQADLASRPAPPVDAAPPADPMAAGVRIEVDAQGTRMYVPGRTVEADDGWIGEAKADKAAAEAEQPAPPPVEEPKYPLVGFPYNPVGRGFALLNCPESLDGLLLPNIEDPNYPIVPELLPRDPAKILDPDIQPVGFGWVSKAWWGRTRYAGFLPKDVEKVKAQLDEEAVKLDPDDPKQRPALEFLLDYEPNVLKPEYYNGAPPDQQLDELRGDEPVVLRNLDKQGVAHFKLPGHVPVLWLDRGDGPEGVQARLDTLVIDREGERVTMLWRGQLPLGNLDDLKNYKKFDVDVKETTLAELEKELYRLQLERQARHHGITQQIDLRALEAEAKKAQQAEAEAAAAGHVRMRVRGAKMPPPMVSGAQLKQLISSEQAAPSPAEPAAPVLTPGQQALLAGTGLPDDVAPVLQGAKVSDFADEGHERLADDRWVADAMREKSAAEKALELDEEAKKRLEIAAKKAALRQRLAEIKAREAEEALAKAKKKKS